MVYLFMLIAETENDKSFTTWCVTLESPGSRRILEQMHARYLDLIPPSKLGSFLRLDFKTFVGPPNIFNCIGLRLGTTYRLQIDFPRTQTTAGKVAAYFTYPHMLITSII